MLKNQNPFTAPLREARQATERTADTAARRGTPMPAAAGATPIGANNAGTGVFQLFGLLDLTPLDATFLLG